MQQRERECHVRRIIAVTAVTRVPCSAVTAVTRVPCSAVTAVPRQPCPDVHHNPLGMRITWGSRRAPSECASHGAAESPLGMRITAFLSTPHDSGRRRYVER
jgi:hypothetical protein